MQCEERTRVTPSQKGAYKGVLFEGEKYLGTTEDSFDVISIFIWPHRVASLKGLVREDFQFIEQKVNEKYPNMEIIGSYFLYKDGKHSWYEVILADPSHPSIFKDKEMRGKLRSLT